MGVDAQLLDGGNKCRSVDCFKVVLDILHSVLQQLLVCWLQQCEGRLLFSSSPRRVYVDYYFFDVGAMVTEAVFCSSVVNFGLESVITPKRLLAVRNLSDAVWIVIQTSKQW